MKYPNITLGRVEAVWNKLGGEEGVERFLRGELTVVEPTRNWREQDGVIYFTVTSDGTIGSGWIERLESKGFRLSEYAKSVLTSPDFKPTSGLTTEIAVFKGELFEDSKRITKNIRSAASRRGWITPNAEIACLIREKFMDEEIEAMGLTWIAAMHEPIEDSVGDPGLLRVGRSGDGRRLSTACDGPAFEWFRGNGFAFVVAPQVCT